MSDPRTDNLRTRIADAVWEAQCAYLFEHTGVMTSANTAPTPDWAYAVADAVIRELEAVPQRIMLSHASQAAESNRLDAADWLERELASVGLECGAGWVLYHLVDGVVARLNGAVDE